jgi:type II secretion system protein H
MRRPNQYGHFDLANVRSGFTLIELLVVVTMVGIIAGLAFPKAAKIQESMALESGAQQVMRELNLAQVRAIKENRSVGFIRLDEKTYRIGAGETRELPDNLEFGSGTPAEIRFASFGPPLTGPASVEIASIHGRKRYVVLNSSGYASLQ